MLRSFEDVSVLVVETNVHGDLSTGQARELLGGGKGNNALLLPLVDRRNASVRTKGARYSGASTKKGLGCLDKHGLLSYSILESNLKDAVGAYPYDLSHMETMGQRIKRLREARDWTQEHLADLTGVTLSAVSQWELDQTKNVKLVPFLRLAKVLETDPHYLVFGPERGAVELSRPVSARPGKIRPKS